MMGGIRCLGRKVIFRFESDQLRTTKNKIRNAGSDHLGWAILVGANDLRDNRRVDNS